MKRTVVLLLLTFLLFSLSSCDNSDKKMDGFTPTELAEYLSSVDGLVAYEPGTVIKCGEDQLQLATFDRRQFAYNGILAIELDQLFRIDIDVENPDPLAFYVPLLQGFALEQSPFDTIIRENRSVNYIRGDSPNNFAYLLRDAGLNSSPEWFDWIKYNIPMNQNEVYAHGEFNKKWYNPITEEFEVGIYCRTFEDSTEVYVVYQEISLFYTEPRCAPYLMSEDMFNHLKNTYEDFRFEGYKKGTVKEFSDWFMGEYVNEIPPAFADIKDKYVYYTVYGNGLSFGGDYENYDAVKMFIPDLEQLGVNFDELRSYIIKATVPHDGTIQDIFWELIG